MITCFGEVLVRLTTLDNRLLVQGGQLSLEIGGAEVNVAAALASLGHHVRLASSVSDNGLGDRAVSVVRAVGVDTSFVSRAPGRMGLYFLEKGAGSRPSTITYDRAASAFAICEPEAIDWKGALAGARLLHTGGITPALGAKGVDLAKAAHAAARSAEVPICFDGNYRSSLWDAWDSDPRSILIDLVADATILIGNHRDISLLLGHEFSGDGAERRREAAEAAFAAFPDLQLIASTARHIITSDHHRISARVDGREAMHQTGDVDVTGIVDRIGTGDAFVAGFLDAWMRECDLAAMAECGLAMTILKHSLPGDMALVTRSQLDGFQAVAGDVRR